MLPIRSLSCSINAKYSDLIIYTIQLNGHTKHELWRTKLVNKSTVQGSYHADASRRAALDNVPGDRAAIDQLLRRYRINVLDLVCVLAVVSSHAT